MMSNHKKIYKIRHKNPKMHLSEIVNEQGKGCICTGYSTTNFTFEALLVAGIEGDELPRTIRQEVYAQKKFQVFQGTVPGTAFLSSLFVCPV